jgi:dynein heavy chain
MSKTITFSSVTKSMNCQVAIEGSLDKRGGKTFGPPNGMKMTVFLDDLSMPEINEWGDQPTLEIVRQIMEFNGFAFLDKDKRGAIKLIEDVQYCAAMSTPGGGKNEIPQRLKRHFGIITMVSVLMFTGCWLLVAGCWLLVTGYCSLVTGHCSLFTVHCSATNDFA